MKFPKDAPKARVIRAFVRLGFAISREREHIALVRPNEDGSRTVLVIPNHTRIKGSTLQTAIKVADVGRDDFLNAYSES